MPRKTLYTLIGALHLIFGLGFLLMTQWTVAIYGVTLNESGTLMTQLLGVADLGSAAILLGLRDLPASKATRVISTKGALEWGLIAIILLLYSVSGLLNFMGWVSVVLFAAIVFLFVRDMKNSGD